MTEFTPYSALIGGLLIGLSATLLMWANGRIAGISGIMFGAFDGPNHDKAWRWWFLVSMVVAGGLYLWFTGPVFIPRTDYPMALIVAAGFAVGFGTRLGSGCTSGHGVCGIARLSKRSILATLTFMATGIATTYVVRHVMGVGA